MSEGGQNKMRIWGVVLYSIRQGHFPYHQAIRRRFPPTNCSGLDTKLEQ